MENEGIVRCHVPGAPYQPGDRVRVVGAVDVGVYDVSGHLGKAGRVVGLSYDSEESYPADPMVVVRVSRRKREAFWREELQPEATP